MKFNSQICTTYEQSKRLLNMRIRPDTADMYLEKCSLPEAGDYYQNTLTAGIDPCVWFNSKINHDIIPAWSLSRLLEIIPDTIPDSKPGFEPYHPKLIKDDSGYILSLQRTSYDCLVGTHIEDSPIECCISIIQWLIEQNLINKEYLK